MPELAEVEWYRKQWNLAISGTIFEVRLHPLKRVFRGTDTRALRLNLTGAKLLRSSTRGKRMLFEFSGDNWLGIHLGMTGKMHVANRKLSSRETRSSRLVSTRTCACLHRLAPIWPRAISPRENGARMVEYRCSGNQFARVRPKIRRSILGSTS